MIAVVVRARGGVSTRYEFAKPEVIFGRAPGNDVVLRSDMVARRHCRVVQQDRRLVLVDMTSPSGTYVNGRKITGPQPLKPMDKIYIGDFIAVVGIATEWPDEADTTPIVEATEVRLLGEIARGDDDARAVYADWLDEHGRPDRAEFLRLQRALAGATADARRVVLVRLRELAETIEPRWRLRVARPVIACRDPACLGDWAALQRTERAHVRSCETCRVDVVYCPRSIDVLTERAVSNVVAIDLPIEDPEGP